MRDMIIRDVGHNFQTGKGCFQVEVGCERFIFPNKDELYDFLDAYISDPDKVENDYYERVGRNMPRPVDHLLRAEEKVEPEETGQISFANYTRPTIRAR